MPPIQLTLTEATALYLSARLASRYTDERDPYMESAFTKLASALPQPIAAFVQETVKMMAEGREDPHYARVFDILTSAWAHRRTVRIRYPKTGADVKEPKVLERKLDPYYIEPSGASHSCYVIGHDHHSDAIRTFKIERIQQIELTAEEYQIDPEWSARDYLKASWDIVHDDEVEVTVRFSAAVAKRVKEAIWHPSQRLTDNPDGSLLLTVHVAGTMEISRWILSWGCEAEVVSPDSLRAQMAEIARRQAANYGQTPAETSIQ